ncbi:MAG: cytochrome P450 [Acidimicrobiaceae bacterium]|nr:cytochrome P450 [Acidimicrobiaceae bacterium]
MDPINRHREIRGYDAVRRAAKDFVTYSSDLLGDRDVRTYRQLPLEADPPRHTLFRAALQPLFISSAVAPHMEAFAAQARSLIDQITQQGGGDIVADVALPYTIGCLGVIYSRPQDVEEWISWGPDVWTAEAYANGEVTAESKRAHRDRDYDLPSQRSGKTLQAYLDRVLTVAEQRYAAGEPALDIWDRVTRLDIDGAHPTREEMQGIASVLLAGGRDTVIKLISGLAWHLIRQPEDRQFLLEHPGKANAAIAEMVRYLSPLQKIERLQSLDGGAAEYVLLDFASANHDPQVWTDPGRVDIQRPRYPHLGFGAGPHSCLGMTLAAHEARAFLDVVLHNWPGWEFDGEPEIEWVIDDSSTPTLIDRFDAVRVRIPTGPIHP